MLDVNPVKILIRLTDSPSTWRTTAGLCCTWDLRWLSNEIHYFQCSTIKTIIVTAGVGLFLIFRRLCSFSFTLPSMQPQSSCRSMMGLKGYYIESSNLRLPLLLLFTRSLVYTLEYKNKKYFRASCY